MGYFTVWWPLIFGATWLSSYFESRTGLQFRGVDWPECATDVPRQEPQPQTHAELPEVFYIHLIDDPRPAKPDGSHRRICPLGTPNVKSKPGDGLHEEFYGAVEDTGLTWTWHVRINIRIWEEGF